jgi:hypothetical protein
MMKILRLPAILTAAIAAAATARRQARAFCGGR